MFEVLERTRRLRVVMELDYEEFIKSRIDEFILDLSAISGCPEEQITRRQFSRGCVRFEGTLEAEAAKRLAELVVGVKALSAQGKLPDELQQVAEFMQRYKIETLDDWPSESRDAKSRQPASKDVIVFVHGLVGGSESFGRLPEFLGDATGWKTLLYEYPSDIWKHSPAMFYVSRNFDNYLRNAMEDNYRRFALIGHSMGGVIVRKALANQMLRRDRLDTHIAQVSLVASPFSGAWLAKLAAVLPTQAKTQIDELRPNSPFMVELNEAWARWREQNATLHPHIRSLYGTADEIVDPATAAVDDPDAISILGADHSSIVKPNAADDEIVVTLKRLIKDCTLSQ